MGPLVEFEHAAEDQDQDHLTVRLAAHAEDGMWTPGPYASLEAGNAIELTVDEFAWLVEDAGPKVLAELRGA